MLINDDCLNALSKFEGEYADMVYLDPPFFTQKNQSLYNKDGDYFEFNDKWNSLDEYLKYIEKRLLEIKRILKKTGSIFLHCDTSASHHLRILLDNVFGKNNWLLNKDVCTTKFNEANEKATLIKDVQNYCQANGKYFIVIVPPNKESAYRDYFPKVIQELYKSPEYWHKRGWFLGRIHVFVSLFAL